MEKEPALTNDSAHARKLDSLTLGQARTLPCADEERIVQALPRYITGPSSLFFSVVLQCSWEAAALTFQFALTNGGPASIIYGSIFAGLGMTFVALSLAELASMDPTVGAQYRWSAAFAPRWNRFWGLMQGWITVFAWICSATSNPALITNIVIGLADFNGGYMLKRWHATLIMCFITLVTFMGNLWLPRFLNALESIGAICHIVFFFICIATLAALAKKSTPHYVFNTLTHNESGWENPGVAWGLGLLTVTYPLTGFDGIIHMSDEVKLSRLRVPRSMIFSVIVNATMQFLYMLTLLFTIGDVERVSSSPLPIIEIYYQATGSRVATNVITIMFLLIIFLSFFNVLASVSRLAWAFAGDRGLPFSRIIATVHPRLNIPLNALLLVTTCICLLALINIASSTAFNAFISLPALGAFISYFFPILFIFIRRLDQKHATGIAWGPFKIGRVAPLVNACAMCYILFMLTWMPFPAILPVDRFNMNYAGPIVGAVIVGGVLDWCYTGRVRFKIPVAAE